MADQDLRSFVAAYERAHSGEVIRVSDQVSVEEDVMPLVLADPPFRQRVLAGPALDLARLPIPRYFPGDAGRYLTAGMLVARDPETGVETEGYHRFQLKGRDRMGVS